MATFGISVGISVGLAVGVGAIEVHAAETVNRELQTNVSKMILTLFIIKNQFPFRIFKTEILFK
jgi:hypothetical protein